MTNTCDALVIGGGPAGATAALLLARAGWRVQVAERQAFPRLKVCGEFLSATNGPLLRELGVADWFLEFGGPPVRRLGIFAGGHRVVADMPALMHDAGAWGRAIGRHHLDTALLEQARAAGAHVCQPCLVTSVLRSRDAFSCTLQPARSPSTTVTARRVILAHGSWGASPVQSLWPATSAHPSDLLGFKVRFIRSRLPDGLMPLLAFPGGYGGMVHSEAGRVSLSCCITRARLTWCRQQFPAKSAGESVVNYIKASSMAVADVLKGSEVEPESWRAAGPIRPGIRGTCHAGVFLVGNAAGEAHPVIAEGISMAMQGASMLARRFIESPDAPASHIAEGYDADWRRAFTWRLRAAAFVASWAMSPRAVAATLPLLRCFPNILTESARQCGKVSTQTA